MTEADFLEEKRPSEKARGRQYDALENEVSAIKKFDA